jgi:hypothetical protein
MFRTSMRMFGAVVAAMVLAAGCAQATAPGLHVAERAVMAQATPELLPEPEPEAEPAPPQPDIRLEDSTAARVWDVTTGQELYVESDWAEDWCATLEGRAGAWLVADDDAMVDASTGNIVVLDDTTRRYLEAVVAEDAQVAPEDVAQIDTLLRLPVPSALACRTAFEEYDR